MLLTIVILGKGIYTRRRKLVQIITVALKLVNRSLILTFNAVNSSLILTFRCPQLVENLPSAILPRLVNKVFVMNVVVALSVEKGEGKERTS